MYFTQRVVGNGSATVIFKERNIIPSGPTEPVYEVRRIRKVQLFTEED